jgi:SRSO17 transposase
VLLERALEAGVPASWVTADEVYGGDPALRVWLEDRDMAYVLATKGTEPLGTATQGSATASRLAAGVPVEQWVAGQRRPRRQGTPTVRLEPHPAGRAGHCWPHAVAAGAPPPPRR